MRTVLARAGTALVAAGLTLLLSVTGYLLWTGHSGSTRATRTVAGLQASFAEPRAATVSDQTVPSSDPTVASSDPTVPSSDPTVPSPGQAFALLTVPRFGSTWQQPVLEGTGRDVLRGGVGHYTGSALPGGLGNLALAGHRTTWGHPFKDVERLRAGDEVIVRTRTARFIYRVTGHLVVDPDDPAVLAAVPGHPDAVPTERLLTLTTCHPEYSAHRRWIVQAVLQSSTVV
jgi:sortase A